MKVFNMIKFIGSKNPKYKWEKIKYELPCKPIEGKGYLDNNDNRQGLWGIYYDNGQLKSKGLYKDGNRDGIWEYYDENGQLFSKGLYKDNIKTGIWESYWNNGQLNVISSFIDNKLNEKYKSYYENGQLKEKCYYTNGIKIEKKMKNNHYNYLCIYL